VPNTNKGNHVSLSATRLSTSNGTVNGYWNTTTQILVQQAAGNCTGVYGLTIFITQQFQIIILLFHFFCSVMLSKFKSWVFLQLASFSRFLSVLIVSPHYMLHNILCKGITSEDFFKKALRHLMVSAQFACY
jgi:hypothetical protein